MQYMEMPRADFRTEAELVRAARRGDEAAFAAIYQEHRSAVFQFTLRFSGSAAAAEDATQECFLALVKGAAFDSDRATLRTYLFGIARNLMLRRLRISRRETEEPTEAVAPVDVLGDLLAEERAGLVERAVAELPALQREVIILFTYEEMSLEEIADIAGTDVGAVKSRLWRARERLRARLAPLLARSPERRF